MSDSAEYLLRYAVCACPKPHGRPDGHAFPCSAGDAVIVHSDVQKARGARDNADRLRAALARWVAAHDDLAEANKQRARAEAELPKHRVPKRMPRNAVMFDSLPEEKKAAYLKQIAEEMAPLQEATRRYVDARAALDAAIVAARAVLAESK